MTNMILAWINNNKKSACLVLILAFALIAIVFLVALYQGREIEIGPVKFGKSFKDGSSPASHTEASHGSVSNKVRSNPSAVSPPPAPEPNCDSPALDFRQGEIVPLNIAIRWHPTDCLMVIETWRSGRECMKIGVTDDNGWDPLQPRSCTKGLRDQGVRSGEVTIGQIRGTEGGRIGIKIWVPNRGIMSEEVFVNVTQ